MNYECLFSLIKNHYTYITIVIVIVDRHGDQFAEYNMEQMIGTYTETEIDRLPIIK